MLTCTKHVHVIERDGIRLAGEAMKERLAYEFWERVHEAMNSVPVRDLFISIGLVGILSLNSLVA
jgi:hypothetical protein